MTDPIRGQEQAAEVVEHALDTVKAATGAAAGVGLVALATDAVLGRARRSFHLPRVGRRWARRFGFGVLIAVSSVATCSFGVDPSKLTAAYGDPVPATTDDAARVLTRGTEALQGLPDTRALHFTMTEAEATSALSVGLMMPELMRAAGTIPQDEIRQASDLEALRDRIWKEADAQRQALAEHSGFVHRMLIKLDPRIRTGDIQVRFEGSGQVVVAGYVQAWRFRQPGIFVVAPHAANGALTLDFVSGRLGRLPMPEFVFDWMGGMLARGILLGREKVALSELSVGDGTFTVTARLGG